MKFSKTDRTAITYKEEEISYKQLNDISTSLSRKLPVKKGDRIVILSENRPEWIYTLLANWKRGVVTLPVDIKFNSEELSGILKDATPKLIICSSESRQTAKEAKDISKVKSEIITFEELFLLPEKDHSYKEDKKDLVIISYTSGTTGNPKGIMLTKKNIDTAANDIAKHKGLVKVGEKVLAILPLHHMYPLTNNIFSTLKANATIVLCADATAEELVANARRHKIEIIVAVPRLLEILHRKLIEKISQNKLGSLIFNISKFLGSSSFSKTMFKKVQEGFGGNLKYIVSGGSKLDRDVERDLRALGLNIVQGYGLSEASPNISLNPVDKTKVGSVGKPIPVNKVKIVDNEIVVKGSNIMLGYYKNSKATAAALKDGWLYTGDLGYLDRDGYLFLVGRKNEMIVLANGKNIFPEEIEEQLSKAEYIREIAISEISGKLHAFIRKSSEVSKEVIKEIVEQYNKKVAPYKRVLGIQFLTEELPKTRLGKLKRFNLHTLVEKIDEKIDEKINENIILSVIKQYFAERGLEAKMKSSLELDLGLDSLETTEFFAFLEEKFSLLMEPSQFKKISDVVDYIEEKGKINNIDKGWSGLLKTTGERIRTSYLLRRLSRFMLKFWSSMYKIEVSGIENIPLGAKVFAPKHISYLDGFWLAAKLPVRDAVRTFFLSKDKHTDKFLVRNIAKAAGILSVGQNTKEALQKSAQILRNGDNIVIFPEGTRSNKVTEFKKTFAMLAKETGAKIVPICMKKEGEIFKIEFLPPISTALSPEEIAKQTEEQIRKCY